MLKCVFVFLALFGIALSTTTALALINRLSFEKKLGGIFNPISISESFKGFFWGRWNWGLFEGGETGKISLIVLILLPLNLSTYVLFLWYVVKLAMIEISSDGALTLSTFENTVGFSVVLYGVFVGLLTRVFSLWAQIWKNPKTTPKERREHMKNVNETMKTFRQTWRYFLIQSLRDSACSRNKQKGKYKYYFEESQLPVIEEMVKQSSKNAVLELELREGRAYSFVVKDQTEDKTIFKGIIKSN